MATAPLSPGFGADSGWAGITTSTLRSAASPARRSASLGATLPGSPSRRVTQRGLVHTSAHLFTGAPSGTTLRELGAPPEFLALEARQAALAARRVELLRRQAALAAEVHELLAAPDGMLRDTTASLRATTRHVWEAQTWGYTARSKKHAPSPRVAGLDKGNALGAKAKELNELEKQVSAGHEEERLLVEAMRRVGAGGEQGLSPRARGVTSFASWRAAYGGPSGELAAASPGYATEWSPKGRFFGGPNSPLPHGHKRLNIFEGFASGAVDLKLGRDLR